MSTFAEDQMDDLDIFLEESGDSAIITHGGVASGTIPGIYEGEYATIDLPEGIVSSSKGAFCCETSYVPSANKTDTLVITSVLHNLSGVSRSVTYVELSPADLGPGMTRFVLKK